MVVGSSRTGMTWLTLVVVLLLAVGVGPTSATGGADNAVSWPPVSRSADTVLVDRGNAAAWTAERVRNASPAPFPEVVEGGSTSGSWRVTASHVVPAKPNGGPIVSSSGQVGRAAEVQAFTAEERGYKYPAPFTRYEVPLSEAKSFPRRAVGALFYTQNGLDYTCSAASVGNYAIWTAGHCIHDGGGTEAGWSTNISFVPAYAGDKACPGQGCPFGVWTGAAPWVAGQWYTFGQAGLTDYDLGGVVLMPLGGHSISERVGSLGFAVGGSANQHWNVFGYPGAAPFSGDRMVTCQASLAYALTTGDAKRVGIGCDMTPGSSGGPWIVDLGTENIVNGTTSHRRPGKTEELLSVYFDDVAWDLYTILVGAAPG